MRQLLPSESIKQQEWFKQIQEQIVTSKRSIDKKSIAEIRQLYQEGKFLCDGCGKRLDNCDYTLEEHVIHLINPSYHWSCEDCFQKDLRNNDIIAIEERKIETWKKDYR